MSDSTTVGFNTPWWGKLSAGLIGWLLGGPLVGLLGVGLGHNLDREIAGLARAWLHPGSRSERHRRKLVLLTTELSLAGALARAGKLAPSARADAFGALCRQLGLPHGLQDTARALFDDGLRADFPLTAVVNDFRRTFHRRVDVRYLLLEYLLSFIQQSGQPNPAQRALLIDIAQRLNISEARLSAFAQGRHARQSRQPGPGYSMEIAEALAMLEVPAWASQQEIKQAYRRQMSRHHPDKLNHQNLPPERLAEAAARTDRIRKAYETLRGLGGG
ncbi:MAG: DnaJ domain-containing protein [Thiohalocapsa sp. PB-PSB1]|jgi:DnaJ like chaperone protein|nr:MAG: hypothetical protein N838_17220 [Thiohalocapsa sp. PB-PSB1]QQO52230.1 MAG: DnaJ domain-containing protein [Thiohalocapsa sp. PB-PSB1]HCS92534.1 hypothetical protein [Chromatiaceae bacterium]